MPIRCYAKVRAFDPFPLQCRHVDSLPVRESNLKFYGGEG